MGSKCSKVTSCVNKCKCCVSCGSKLFRSCCMRSSKHQDDAEIDDEKKDNLIIGFANAIESK